ncbi:MAG: high-potential iron-sulfur protein [Deltaproteobacteria bacterium]|nr:high-potential iron-sulfur protein [Deltaproteobacteria bacterium]
MSKMTRRELGRHALTVLAAAPLFAACGGGELECAGSPSADQRAVRTALHYVDHGPDTSRHCSRCSLYVGDATACGTCAAVPGAIHPEGTCDSFVARAS